MNENIWQAVKTCAQEPSCSLPKTLLLNHLRTPDHHDDDDYGCEYFDANIDLMIMNSGDNTIRW